ncbi:DNA polymerase-3 subunit epsilon [Selenomonas ruminantium]|uniref:DNA polymerase-3 subunit epsilon n=1 Tax=Selenomonas ruminantium TaxID=971 RepID=A0A1I3DZS7_SELRU|nr:3'-5' exonuclease [Selenomonas ruminantium]SFH92195.1 DNA polymerase-3 subunit epsilon [Selenomonas ruminantium]
MENITDLTKLICFDTETTGLSGSDEVLQLAIVNGHGDILFDELFKPKHHTAWPHAENVHHISPAMLENKNTIDYYMNDIARIIAEAQYYVGYNINFDIRMLKQSGFAVESFYRKKCRRIDVMKEFAHSYSKYKVNLSTCADYFHYDWGRDTAHGALADAKATLYCFRQMNA